MLRGRDVDEVVGLRRQGVSIRAISRLTGYDRKTSSRYLSAPSSRPVYGPRTAEQSKLEAFKPYLRERLQAGVWNARVLLRELRERNYEGGYTILTDWLRPQREQALSTAVRRFETPPGQQAQVDWGHLGSSSAEDRPRQLWGFTMTLATAAGSWPQRQWSRSWAHCCACTSRRSMSGARCLRRSSMTG